MGRPKGSADGRLIRLIYHMLNRANTRMTIFEKDGDFEAFERILQEGVDRTGIGLLAYCALLAKLVIRAKQWRWSSLHRCSQIAIPDDANARPMALNNRHI